jgi:antirestriction protein ArdC
MQSIVGKATEGVAESCGYTKGLWGTYRQWQAEGAQVRKGERGSVVVLWKQFGANDADAQAPDDEGGSRRLGRACV